MTEEMAVLCSQRKCCNETGYKRCVNIKCKSLEDRKQCSVPKNIKSIDCFCVVNSTNCDSDGIGESYGTDTDDNKHYIWTDNGCQGNFRVCFKRARKPTCNLNIVSTKTTEPTTVQSRRSSSYYNGQQTTVSRELATTDAPNTLSRKDEVNWKGYLVILPIAVIIMGVIVAVLICMKKRKSSQKRLETNLRGPERNYTQTLPNHNDDEVYTEISDEAALAEKRKSNIPVYNICHEYPYFESKDAGNLGNCNYYVGNSTIENRTADDKVQPSAPQPEYFVPLDDITYDSNQKKLSMERYNTPYDSKHQYFVLEKDDVDRKVKNKNNDNLDHASDTVSYFVLEK